MTKDIEHDFGLEAMYDYNMGKRATHSPKKQWKPKNLSLDPAASMFAGDKRIIPYHKQLNSATGSVLATLFLRQVAYWAKHWNNPFYKFNGPCEHVLYREGDSWQEELGFSKREFATARDAVSTKITHGVSKKEVLECGTDVKSLVLYWTDSNNVTTYLLNVSLFNRVVNKAYR